MGILLLMRDSVSSDVDNVKHTYSSWGNCMHKAYCKWPAIIGIIILSLIIVSVLACAVRCMFCGAACCSSCCPSSRRSKEGYYQQQPPNPYPPFSAYSQYQQPQQPPVYGSGGLGPAGGPQTASFNVPSNRGPGGAAAASNADSLPAMPTWDDARTHHVEDEDEAMEDVEMEKLVARPPPASPQPPNARSQWEEPQQQQQQHVPGFYPQSYDYQQQQQQRQPSYYDHQQAPYTQSANPYSSQGIAAAAPHHSSSPYDYAAAQSHPQPQRSFASPTYPSPYASAPAPSAPPQAMPRASAYGAPSHHDDYGYQAPQSQQQVPRKPVSGSWREL